MPQGRLYIGNRRYSSWSLRGWLAVRLAGLEVEEVVIPLAGGDTPAVKAVSPSGLVPYLEHGGHRIWETLAIIEYCAEIAPGLLWPHDRAARIHARVIAAEMHGGFRELRVAMPMNLGRDFSGLGRTPGALADIARIEALWAQTRARFGGGGPFLFGAQPNAADAMFAPVVARFLSYRPELTEASHAYCKAIRLHPLVAAWYDGAAAEPTAWLVAKYENP
jgi:glutathione S-transferase